MKTKYIITFLLFSAFINLTAQNNLIQLSGIIHDKTTGEALPGASIQIKGTTTGTQTDTEGKFILKLRLSFLLQLLFRLLAFNNRNF